MSLAGVWCSQVVVPQRVNAVLGKNVTLECRVELGANLTLTQSSWERRLPSGSVTVAVYNPLLGISIPPEFIQRLYFRSPSSHDATIILENVGFSDVGLYTCKVATFPLGNTQATTTVNVLGKYVQLHTFSSIPVHVCTRVCVTVGNVKWRTARNTESKIYGELI